MEHKQTTEWTQINSYAICVLLFTVSDWARCCGGNTLYAWCTRFESQQRHGQSELNAWSRVLLEKLTVTQLIKNSPPFMEPKGSLRVYNSPPLVPILSQMNPVHTFPPYFHLILSSHLGLRPFPTGFRTKIRRLPFSFVQENAGIISFT
jgi:hypothetical protein